MIHNLTIPERITYHYHERQVFERYARRFSHIMLSNLFVRVSTAELRELLADAEKFCTVRATSNPQITVAYVHFAEKCRAILRAHPDDPNIGRDGKSAAAGD